jgi:hypothetical protein
MRRERIGVDVRVNKEVGRYTYSKEARSGWEKPGAIRAKERNTAHTRAHKSRILSSLRISILDPA